jgi:hypothetical protein
LAYGYKKIITRFTGEVNTLECCALFTCPPLKRSRKQARVWAVRGEVILSGKRYSAEQIIDPALAIVRDLVRLEFLPQGLSPLAEKRHLSWAILYIM